LQGNILKGHGRDHSVHLFLQFKLDEFGNVDPLIVDDVKHWIGRFSHPITSAFKQANEAKAYRENQIKGQIFTNFFLSSAGYKVLNFKRFQIPTDQLFLEGMKSELVGTILRDPDIKTWDSGFQSKIHALILIADDNLENLLQKVDEITQELEPLADIVQRENGFVLRNKKGQAIEHFGFVDGISQPLFFKRDILKSQSNNLEGKWDSRIPLSTVLAKDYNGKTEDSYGSYLVYRKLEQDVEAFRNTEKFLADKLGISKELAGASIVGRFRDGTPVTLSDMPTDASPPTNNFNYDDDHQNHDLNSQPSKCPFHAHIRKTNPRGDTGNVELEKEHQIVRRGESYGESDPNQTPKNGSGLLFLCFQGDINNQFFHIQNSWANFPDFARENVGPDPIIGVGSGGKTPRDVIIRQWIKNWGKEGTVMEGDLLPDGFENCVHFKGGEFFFAPSISFLKSLY
jgi:Dyp-type peroxidase family